MKYTTILFPTMVAAMAAKGNPGKGNGGGAGAIAANGLPQLPNPGPNIPVPTTFTPVSTAVPGATTAPKATSQQAIAALQAAADNWSFDTGMVSNFQNTGKGLAGNAAQFQNAANIGYNSEVNELTHKAILDQIIGNDPDVSIANQTLMNGCFQSVVDNLQIMSLKGPAQQNLINNINIFRCTQVLPSIDTYMAVAARVIGAGATLRTAIRPDACAGIVKAAPNSAFPGGLTAVNVRSNTDKVTNGNSFAGTGTPSVPAPANAAAPAAPASSGTATTGGGKNGAAGAGTAAGASSASVPAAPLSTGTTSTASGTGANAGGSTSGGQGKGKKSGKAGKGRRARRSMKFVA